MRRSRTWSVGITGAVLASALALAAGPTPTAHAAGLSLRVSTVTDAPDANPGDGICASTLPANPCTLRAAIQTANANPGFDSITIDPALEPPAPRPDPCVGPTFTLTVAGAGEDKAATGDLDVTGPTSIGDPCGFTVDGGHADRVWDISASIDVTNVITQNGLAVGADQRGSGFLVRKGASLTASGGRVTDNGAAEPADGADGGGIYAEPGTSVQLTGSGVFGNNGDSGGGIWTAGELSLHLTDVMDGFANRGAGLYLADGATVVADHVQAGDSSAAVSGGVTYAAAGSHATFTASIMANSSAPTSGGLLFVEHGAVVGLVSSSISSGQSDGHGGGIFNDGQVTAYNGEFSGNQSVNDDGGAIYNGPTGRVEVERSFGNTQQRQRKRTERRLPLQPGHGGRRQHVDRAQLGGEPGLRHLDLRAARPQLLGDHRWHRQHRPGRRALRPSRHRRRARRGHGDGRQLRRHRAPRLLRIGHPRRHGHHRARRVHRQRHAARRRAGRQCLHAAVRVRLRSDHLPASATSRSPQLGSPSTNTDDKASSTECQSVVVDGHGTSRLTGAEGTCDVGPLERSGSSRRCRSSHVPTTSRRSRRSPRCRSTRCRPSAVTGALVTNDEGRRPSQRRSPASTSAPP